MSKPNEGPDRIDYQETPDVTEVHAAVQREKPEPSAEVTPMPLWLTGVCGVAIAWAGIYFGLFMGGINGNVFNEYESTPAALFPLPEKAGGKGAGAEAAEQSLAQQGKAVYSQVCVACHQAAGTGLPGQYPPLAGSDIVQGSEKRVAAILLKGLQGPITVAGKPFTSPNVMPAWEAQLSPKKIAAVLSFVRQEWGNKAAEISEAKIVAAKKEFAAQTASFTEATLHAIPEDATLPDAAGAAAPNAAKPAAAAAPGAAAAPAAAAAAPAPAAAGAAPAAASPEVLALGKTTYMTICIACHQPTGAGLPMVFPPLTKSPYVNGNPERFAAIILKGNIGPFTVDGKPFNNVMPPQEAMLTDDKIAATMSFVRASFGNTAGAVTPDVVAAARKKFADRKTSWTQPELDAWKDEAPAK
ncbi:MAG TPA: cytochrome c [Chthoniobacter sp.]|nr:cytochrome c [Chthoniobacter sp.]